MQLYIRLQKRSILVIGALLFLVCATIVTDFLFAQFQDSSFYLSESLLFSSYWLLFLPLLTIIWRAAKRGDGFLSGGLVVALVSVVHLIAYPGLIWLLSKTFYDHTFSYGQTFRYGLTAYGIYTFIIYSLSLPLLSVYRKRNMPVAVTATIPGVPSFLSTILVSDTNNRKVVVETASVFFIAANPPYVNIHLQDKKHLHKTTLKSLETKLDPLQFIRVHKSCIVNITRVRSYQSRLNGDYDLLLRNDAVLRVSRNYAAVFKAAFDECHRLAPE